MMSLVITRRQGETNADGEVREEREGAGSGADDEVSEERQG